MNPREELNLETLLYQLITFREKFYIVEKQLIIVSICDLRFRNFLLLILF
jgi:hypothetical protein